MQFISWVTGFIRRCLWDGILLQPYNFLGEMNCKFVIAYLLLLLLLLLFYFLITYYSGAVTVNMNTINIKFCVNTLQTFTQIIYGIQLTVTNMATLQIFEVTAEKSNEGSICI
jgi:hypothetical protein